jgi:phosphohistidine phosphatase
VDLYLVRHAPAFRRDPHRWPHSSRRPLTPEGEEEFRFAARGLATIVHRVDVMLSSPNLRTWHTAEILAELDCWPAPEPSPALRTGSRRGSPEKATLALEDYANANSVAVVGHKPRLRELAAYLLTGEGDGMKIKIRQGSVMCIRFGGAPAPGTGKLHWLLTPEALLFLAGQHFS